MQQQYKECQELLGLYQQYLSQQQAQLNQSIAQLSQEAALSKVRYKVPPSNSNTCEEEQKHICLKHMQGAPCPTAEGCNNSEQITMEALFSPPGLICRQH